MSAAAACGVPVGPTGLERGQAGRARVRARAGLRAGNRCARRGRAAAGLEAGGAAIDSQPPIAFSRPKNSNHKPRTPEPEKREWSAEVKNCGFPRVP